MKRSRQLDNGSLPQLPDINQEIFQRAGISEQDRAELLKVIFAKTVRRLKATTVKVFHGPGGIVYSKPLVDHGTQGKAIEQGLQLVGLQKQEAPKLVVKASVVLPPWAIPQHPKDKRKLVDVTPTLPKEKDSTGHLGHVPDK